MSAQNFSDAVEKELVKSNDPQTILSSLSLSDNNMLTTTEKGALSYTTTAKGRVDCFYGVLRGTTEEKIEELADSSWEEDKLHTLKLIAYVRDCRGGKGERKCGRILLNWLGKKSPQHLKKNLKHYIATYGRFDDVVCLFGTPCEPFAIEVLAQQLEEDLEALKANKKTSLAAKWIPSERKSSDKKFKVNRKLAAFMKLTPAQLRKRYLSPLRKSLDLVESKMCANEWTSINFNHVPSVAMHIYGKVDHAFYRHVSELFREWKTKLATGETKVNASVLFPHQVVEQYMEHQYTEPDPLLEAQWREMVKQGREIGLSGTLVLSDVSGSMSGTPLIISATMGLLVSEISTDDFKNLILTFESVPQFHSIQGDSLCERLQHILKAPWGGSTNFSLAFRSILTLAKKNQIPQSSMPSRLLVVSDMQFDEATESKELTNFQELEKEFKAAGYDLPHLVFWNVRGDVHNFPVQHDQKNASLVSGFSTAILKAVIAGKDITPYSTMINAITDPRYDLITDTDMDTSNDEPVLL